MTNDAEGKERVRGRLRMALAALAILVLLLVVPPLINVNHFKARITQLISQTLARPVHMSSVQVRLLPWPGFEISDLSVAEDPAYGAEPVLHAGKVVASIRLLALVRGHVEIGKISVEDASLNLVRVRPGQWNLDPLFRTAAEKAGSSSGARRVPSWPYLEATDSRIDFKNGAEKLPFSLVNADLSFWQESSGEWRIRLRAQPARTDVSLHQEETGIVRMEASVRRAPTLSQMPLQLDLDWREAQFGQLARIITGSDPGWRGALTGELHLNGTADAAKVTMRLRAAGVHRAEFTPASPLDFDANCAFVYDYAQRSLQNLACASPLGDGSVHLTGEMPGLGAPPQFSVALDRIPVTAGLDALRTLRSGLASDLDAKGTVSGKIVYAGAAVKSTQPEQPAKPPGKHPAKPVPQETGPLTGTLTVSNFTLSGGGLTRPLAAPKITLEPVVAAQGSPQALAGTVAIPAGGAVPLAFNVRLSLTGYRVGVHGQTSFARAREMAQAAGIPGTDAIASLAGDPIAVDLSAAGPWLPPEQFSSTNGVSPEPQPIPPLPPQSTEAPAIAASITPAFDTLAGTVIVHNANWKADYLANHLEISEATLRLDSVDLRWDPVAFSYGPLNGTASMIVPLSCPSDQQPARPCPAQFQIHFDDLDVAALETALLGAREKGTLLSDLIERFHPATAPPWPQLEGTVAADSLVLGPVTLQQVAAILRILPASAEITSFDAGLLGGTVHATGSLQKPATDQDKPDYTFEGDFQKLNAADVGSLVGLRWTGDSLDGNGKVELTGYTDKDLASSAKGMLHFETRQGMIAALKPPSALDAASPVDAVSAGDAPKAAAFPAALTRFSGFTADATIANGAITISQDQVTFGARKRSVQAIITFGDPPTLAFPAPKEARAQKH
ncbi:conserved hypothetical protein [Candidatus Sulfotelmatomonas gaucii]|uniref:AsmA domain-containing protein n=1 Tax=Candidatus Sulfuritelmatomonas gaucii TaxID=2043161 RepID=A0A2N9LI19_9BACT|nr:conserved hypothetical protein [Candidatus Sulfotelmatomonas gaucii]